jgi:parvulin-like peptidyl-prolyl isomerase
MLVVTAACSPEAGTPSDPSQAALQSERPEAADVVARVGDRSLSLSDLEASFRGHPAARDQRTLRPGELRAALERRIDLLLVEAEADAQGLTSDPEYIAEREALLRRAEDRALGVLRRRLVEALAAEVEVSDEELRARMEEMPRRFQTREIHLRRLVVDDQAVARDAARRIAAGEAFADVAAEVSTDPALRSARGDLGPLERSALPPQIAGIARSLRQPGQVSEVFRAEGKWNLIELVAPMREVARPFEDVRPELEREVRAAKASQLLQQRLAERRATMVSIDEERLAALMDVEPRAGDEP